MTGLWASILAFAAITFAPGPANLAVGMCALAHGWTRALPMALGLATGFAAWGVVAALGLGAVLAASEGALTALRLAGGAYLLWLALGSARGALSDAPPAPAPPAGAFRRGLVLNLSNPKAALAWLAALSVGAGAGGGTLALAALAGMALGLANYLIWAGAFSLGGPRRAYARARRGMEGAAAALLGGTGAGLVGDGLSR